MKAVASKHKFQAHNTKNRALYAVTIAATLTDKKHVLNPDVLACTCLFVHIFVYILSCFLFFFSNTENNVILMLLCTLYRKIWLPFCTSAINCGKVLYWFSFCLVLINCVCIGLATSTVLVSCRMSASSRRMEASQSERRI